jgi:predicted aspartyl protease
LISRRTLLSQAGLIAVAGAAAWWARDHVLWPSPDLVFSGGATASGWLPFTDPEQGVVIVEARVNGMPVSVLVDSGAQSSVIDIGLAERLGLPTAVAGPVIVAYGVSGGPQLGRAATLDLALGALTLKGLRAALFDLSGISAASGRLFSLILGQDALKALVADIDFPGDRLSLADPKRYSLPTGARPATARLQGRELRVPITVEGAPLEVVLDTGASATLSLSAEAAEAAGLLSGRPLSWARSITFGGSGHDRVVQVEAITFAGRTYADLPVNIYEPSGARVPSGLLGVGALEPFRVVIDIGRGLLHLA